MINTPFGDKPLVYADYTASGRSLGFIEDFIQQKVLPYYANTHTESSFTGAQTTLLREQARQQIRLSLNASDQDSVIFCGPGATAAINKLIDMLNLRLPADLDQRYALADNIPAAQRPVVFIGPYEHHSNELPWRESICDVVSIPLNATGTIDVEVLAQQLEQYADRELKIGSFSAASNVTGIKSDISAINQLLKQHNALSFWDYAAGAPYMGIDMSDKDAVFISPHKFVGGPGTPGVLVLKHSIVSNSVPAMPGGGTVMYVTPEDHCYTANTERREEGGTPAIVESIRAGLVFKLQQDVGTDRIEALEHTLITNAMHRWQSHPNIEILGNTEAERLSIVSLRIKHQGKDLHYGFAIALLNDLFGIQARGGCSCAGPYGHSLLGMDMPYSKAIEAQIKQGTMVLRPGWLRLNFNYFIDQNQFQYLLRAIELVAEHGWKLLPYYCFDKAQAVWRYQDQRQPLPVQLSDIRYQINSAAPAIEPTAKPSRETILQDTLASAEQQLQQATAGQRYDLNLDDEAKALCWFVQPEEIA
jgi:selenocysteine lyase/cysteine desulfurase